MPPSFLFLDENPDLTKEDVDEIIGNIRHKIRPGIVYSKIDGRWIGEKVGE